MRTEELLAVGHLQQLCSSQLSILAHFACLLQNAHAVLRNKPGFNGHWIRFGLRTVRLLLPALLLLLPKLLLCFARSRPGRERVFA